MHFRTGARPLDQLLPESNQLDQMIAERQTVSKPTAGRLCKEGQADHFLAQVCDLLSDLVPACSNGPSIFSLPLSLFPSRLDYLSHVEGLDFWAVDVLLNIC